MPTIVRNPDGSLPLAEIKAELDASLIEYSIEKFPDKHRKHLGVSAIGDKCLRKLYNIFRWVKLDFADPRMRRLWDRGKREEEIFSEILTWMGFFVREIDPKTDRQYRFAKWDDHYGGSGDTIALLPWFRGDDDPKILCEYKTHNNKQFQKLLTEGLKKAHWKHWVQMCCYGKEFGCEYGLYCAVNKDNDEIFFDFIKLDWNVGIEAENKARDIIYATFPRTKLVLIPLILTVAIVILLAYVTITSL